MSSPKSKLGNIDDSWQHGGARKPVDQMKALLDGYGEAVAKSRDAGRAVSFRVVVAPDGKTAVSAVEELPPVASTLHEPIPEPGLEQALAAARGRGRVKAAEILGGADMLSAERFAALLGTTRVTVNAKRQSGQVLGLSGATRGFRYPVWQIDPDGRPYPALATLHLRLGGPWAVYRFLVQSHGELDGLTGREALERGQDDRVLAVAESIGRDFR